MHLLQFTTFAVLSSLTGLVVAAQGSIQRFDNFGPNPNNLAMYSYRPSGLQTNPALIVAIHFCGGSASAYFSFSPYADLADQYKNFMVIYPEATRSSKCFDLAQPECLKHEAGGDSLGIASAVRYAIRTWNVNPKRVFVTGFSSGGMTTNVMLATYPELFQAATAYAAVPYGCFGGTTLQADERTCVAGNIQASGQVWGDLVRAAYPGYNGTRPRFQTWHGTGDNVVNIQTWREQIKQWTNVFGVSETPTSVTQDYRASGVTRNMYGENFAAVSVQGAGHVFTIDGVLDLEWFGLVGGGQPTNPPTNHPTQPPTQPPTTNPPSTTGAPRWGQCGGIGWNGAKTCQSPWTCQKLNDWYYQCL